MLRLDKMFQHRSRGQFLCCSLILLFYIHPVCRAQCEEGCFCYEGECQKCKAGYYRNGTYCSTCDKNCILCSSQNQCLVCAEGYTLFNATCVPCGKGCRICFWVNNRFHCHTCQTGFAISDNDSLCSKCSHGCKDCESASRCTHCTVGFFLKHLTCHKCPQNCSKCQSSDMCSECQNGHYGPQCEKTCSDKCHMSQCKNDTGICLCENGTFGAACAEQCPESCESCWSLSDCIKCKSGYYGTACEFSCSIGCFDGSCNKISGECNHNLCKPKFEGRFCDQCHSSYYGDLCEHHCPETCLICKSATKCSTCQVGYYGQWCENKCSPACFYKSCKQDSGECYRNQCGENFDGPLCDRCLPGKHGQMCDFECPDNCTHCHSETYCSTCRPGHYGQFCQHECSNGCINKTCVKENGSCDCKENFIEHNCSACVVGMYGLNCSENCSTDCVPHACHRESGHCSFGCQSNKFGTRCEKSCLPRCTTCTTYTNCTRCTDDYWGDTCENPCPAGCQGHLCHSDGSCVACPQGYYGKYCNIICPNNCPSNSCNGPGICLHCAFGWFGTECNETCPITCRDYVCSRNGLCMLCKQGYHLTKCEYKCSDICANCSSLDICPTECVRTCFSAKDMNTEKANQCLSKCPERCVNMTWDDHEDACIYKCTVGFWGQFCNNECPTNCLEHRCDKYNGTCLRYCSEGFFGENCTFAKDSAMDLGENQGQALMSVGISVTVISALTAAVIGITIIIRKRYNRRNSNETVPDELVTYSRMNAWRGDEEQTNYRISTIHGHSVSDPSERENISINLVRDINHGLYKGNRRGVKMTGVGAEDFDAESDLFYRKTDRESIHVYSNAEDFKQRRIAVRELRNYVTNKTLETLADEFDSLPKGLIKSYAVSQKEENRSKNRYANVYPYDKNRVVLTSDVSDYINASYIDGHRKRRAYIACIGPTESHMDKFVVFWEMVWQENVSVIVMLTNLIENGVEKCGKYWPDSGHTERYGNIFIMGRMEEVNDDGSIIVRTFHALKDEQSRVIYQIHFTSWPDKRVPEKVSSIVELQRKVSTFNAEPCSPLLVHCSAGVGRTGTFIALDILTNEGREEGHVDVYACVRNLREERVNMLQTLEQYRYLHEALVESLLSDT